MRRQMHLMRTYSGPIMAVCGVVLVITWVIGPSITPLLSPAGGHGSQKATAFTWDHGSVTDAELAHMKLEHQMVTALITKVAEKAMKNGAPPPRAPGLGRFDQPFVIPISSKPSDQMIVDIMLLAEKGKQLGVKIDNEGVKAYLHGISGHKLAEGDWLDIAQEVRGDEYRKLVSVAQIFERLKLELVALNTRYLLAAGPGGFDARLPSRGACTPSELWEFYSRFSRRYKIEAYPIDVRNLFSEVSKPGPEDERELQKLYEEGRDRVPFFGDPRPGFKRPHQIDFEYLLVSYEPFLEAAKKKITPAQIQEEYEAGAKRGDFNALELPPATAPPAKEKPPQDKEPAAEKPADTKPAEAKPGEAKAPPAETKPAESKLDEKKPAPAAEPDKKADAPKSASSALNSEKRQLASSCGDEPAKAAPPEKAAAPADAKPADAKPADAKPADAKPADAKPADAKKEDAKKEDTKEKETEKKAPRVKSLEEVHDQIVNKLAAPLAEDARRALIAEIMPILNDYSLEFNRWDRNQKSRSPDPSIVKPAEMNIKELAEKYHLQHKTTGLVDRSAVFQNELGQNASLDFQPAAGLFKPIKAESARGNTFIYWRREELPEAPQTFDQAQAQVVAAWQRRKALDLAQKKAAELITSSDAAKSLKQTLPADEAKKVIEPKPFSWMTEGNAPGGMPSPQINFVLEIEGAGDEFMSAVFSHEPGELCAAANDTQTVVYVVRIIADEPEIGVRREMFSTVLQRGVLGNFALLQLWSQSRFDLSFKLITKLRDDYHVKWTRSPDQLNSQDMLEDEM